MNTKFVNIYGVAKVKKYMLQINNSANRANIKSDIINTYKYVFYSIP